MFVFIVGFHRSATSATAEWLYRAGLPLGEQLMAGAISNLRGHFEDMHVVDLHDGILTRNGTSWQFHDEVQLDIDEKGRESIGSYINHRSNQSEIRGVKDPRICLYL